MSEVATGRYSTRKRKKNTRYTNDAFAGLNLELDASEHEGSLIIHSDSASEENFTPDVAADEAEEDEVESLENGDVEVISSAGEDAGEDEISDADLIPVDSDGDEVPTQKKRMARINKREAASLDEVHTRGTLIDQKTKSARDLQTLNSFGTDEEAKIAMLKGMDKWFDEITMPSRRTGPRGKGGMCHSFFVKEEARHLEATKGWDWYYDKGGRQGFRDRQKGKMISAYEAQKYMPSVKTNRHILIGAQSQQKVYNLAHLRYLNINDAFPAHSKAHAAPNQSGTPKHKRRCWILNGGDNVQALDWCPNQPGSTQYLAMATLPHSKITTESIRGDHTSKAPGFAPSGSDPASIQLWAFGGTTGSDASTIDMTVEPSLSTLICMDWGGIMQLKWCPSLRDRREQDEEKYLGQLAILCRDGITRVLDITIPTESSTGSSTSTRHIHITSAAFAPMIPNTISTCLAWLSSTHLAVGHANGHVAVYDISTTLCRPQETDPHYPPVSTNAKPIYYMPISTSYLLSIQALLPSHPHLLLATSTTGILSLHSLPHATTSHTSTARTRLGTSAVCWLEGLHHVLSAEQSQVLRSHNLRQFHQSQVITHTESVVSCVAASALHTSVIVGEVNGSVMVVGPVRRVMARRSGGDHYAQRWFGHVWRRGRPVANAPVLATSDGVQSNGDAAMENAAPGAAVPAAEEEEAAAAAEEALDYPNGLTRLTFGYSIENLSASSDDIEPSMKKRQLKKKSNTRSAEGLPVHLTTIYELESGINAVCWNPNMQVGGWAAAGCGDGLVVVEDVCWDDV